MYEFDSYHTNIYREEIFVGLGSNKAEDLDICGMGGGVSSLGSGWTQQALALLNQPNINCRAQREILRCQKS